MAEGPAKPPSDDASVLRLLGSATGVGFEFLLTVLLPGALGYWIDRKCGTAPWLMIAGGVMGFGIGLFRMLKVGAATMK